MRTAPVTCFSFGLAFALLAGCGEAVDTAPSVLSRALQVDPPGHGDAPNVVDRLVLTASGAVRGFVNQGVLTFLGIPYAAPPVGDLRWRAPQPPAPWAGLREADAPGSPCTQRAWDNEAWRWTTRGDEDCLYLNVFVPPGTHRDAHLATMVHLHGGGNAGGEGYTEAQALVSRDVAVVTLNYRLNVAGFLGHPALTAEGGGHSSNYALLDQIAALEWVQANIASFGGDPDNVTLFGLSAGSFDTTALAASPLTEGLITRAAIQGSVPWSDSLRDVEQIGQVLANRVGCGDVADPAACLRAVPARDLVLRAPSWFNDMVPVRDGLVLPDYPAILLRDRNLPLLIGNDREERAGYTLGSFPTDFTEEEYVALMDHPDWGYGPLTDEALSLYPVSDYDSPFWALVTVDTDWVYTCATRRVALSVAAQGAAVYRYLYTHVADRDANDGFPLAEERASHAHEEGYIWGQFEPWYTPSPQERHLSAAMSDYWTNFAKNGDPNGRDLVAWPRYDATHERILLLDTPPSVLDAYHVPHCEMQERAYDAFIFNGETLSFIEDWLLLGMYENPGGPAPGEDVLASDFLNDGAWTQNTIRQVEGMQLAPGGRFVGPGERPTVVHIQAEYPTSGTVDLNTYFRQACLDGEVWTCAESTSPDVWGDPPGTVAAYLFVYVTNLSGEEQPVDVALGSDDSAAVSLRRVDVPGQTEVIGLLNVDRASDGAGAIQDRLPALLPEGVSLLTFLIAEGGGDWEGRLVLLEPGTRTPANVSYSLTPP